MIGEDDYDFVVVLVVRVHVADGLAAAGAGVPIIITVLRCEVITVDPSKFAGLYLYGNAQESMHHTANA